MNAQSSANDFDYIYAHGGWDGLGSGPGSTVAFTVGYRQLVEKIIRKYGVKSVVDLGCGDWQFSRLIDWNDAYYIGIDVVKSVIESNRIAYGETGRITFANCDVTQCDIPHGDLLIVKDLLHHLSRESVDCVLQKSLAWPLVLWTVDLNEDGSVANTSASASSYFSWLPIAYEFDRSVENYRYGRKVTLLDSVLYKHEPETYFQET